MSGDLALPADYVALRKESVDRNYEKTYITEMLDVALRKESVDRNIVPRLQLLGCECRSPQGERG